MPWLAVTESASCTKPAGRVSETLFNIKSITWVRIVAQKSTWTYTFCSSSHYLDTEQLWKQQIRRLSCKRPCIFVLDLCIEDQVLGQERVHGGRTTNADDVAGVLLERILHASARPKAACDHEGNVPESVTDGLCKVQEKGLACNGACRSGCLHHLERIQS